MKAVAQLRTLILLSLCACCLSMPASAQSLQRFFSTPEQRIVLDRKRQNESVAGGSAENISIPALQNANQQKLAQPAVSSPEREIKRVVLEGSVLSSDGSYTVWINGRSYRQHSLPRHMQLIEPFQQGQLKIYNADKNHYYHLKPGQTLDLDSGLIVESFNRESIGSASADLMLQDAMKVPAEIGQTSDGESDDKSS